MIYLYIIRQKFIIRSEIMILFGKVCGLGVFRCRSLYVKSLRAVQSRSGDCVWASCSPSKGVLYYSSLAPPPVLSVQSKHGRPMLSVPLPSRGEMCQFFLRPALTTVHHFLSDLKREDLGVVTAGVLTADGERISSSTSLDSVLNKDFQLLINDTTYTVQSQVRDTEVVPGLDEVRDVLHRLHCAVHLPNHLMNTHTQLLQRRDALLQELGPLEEVQVRLMRRAERQVMSLAWAGLAFLSFQGSFLGYLTWYVFAWDVMEPITCFLTYTVGLGFMAYYLLTKQDLIYPAARDRQVLHVFHRKAASVKFNVLRYNHLKEELSTVEGHLERLKNPIQLQLPVNS